MCGVLSPDKYGRKNIEINWSIFNCDIEKIKLISKQFVQSWNMSSQFKLKMIEEAWVENGFAISEKNIQKIAKG